MDIIHDAVAWYQKKIGSYDKQLWEQSVEQKLLRGIQYAPRKSGRVKTELIDVDLVRGSTFSKAKPQVPWTAITQRAIMRVIFFPLFYRWWVQQTSRKFLCFLLCLYVMQVSTTVIYMMNMSEYLAKENVSLTEVLVPFILMVILALIHSQTVLTHWSHKPLVREGKAKKDGSRPRKRKSSTRTTGSGDPENASEMQERRSAGSEASSAGQNDHKSTKSHLVSRRCSSRAQLEHSATCRDSATCSNPAMCRDLCSGSHTPGSEKESDNQDIATGPTISADSTISTDVTDLKFGGKMCNGVKTLSSLLAQNAFEPRACAEPGRSEAATKLKGDNCVKLNSLSQHDWESSKRSSPSVTHGAAPLHEHSTLSQESKATGCDSHRVKVTLTSEEESSGSRGSRFEIISTNLTNISCSENGCEKLCNGEIANESGHIMSENGAVGGADTVLEDSLDASFSKEEEETSSNDEGAVGKTTTEWQVRRKRISGRKDSRNFKKSDSRLGGSGAKVVLIREESAPAGDVTHSPSKENRSETEEEAGDKEFFTLRRSYSSGHSSLRRRKSGGSVDGGHETPSYISRTRKVPTSLGVRIQELKESTGLSSSDGETSPTSPPFSKGTLSSEEWEFRMQSDVATSTSSASSCASDRGDMSDEDDNMEVEGPEEGLGGAYSTTSSTMHVINLLQPPSASSMSSHPHNVAQPDRVSCVIWERNECKKVDLTALDIGWAIIEKVDNIPESSDYIMIGLAFSCVMGLVPIAFRAYLTTQALDITSLDGLYNILLSIVNNPWRFNLIAVNGILQRFCLSLIFFFLLSVADRTFKQRLLYAKHFCYLTSSRRAKKYDMPHFRLNKVRSIKTWLSLRSYLKKRGPQRSVDVIVSSAFMLSITHLAMMSIQLLKDTDKFLDSLCNWELCVWCLALGIYLLRFLTLGLKINKKYRNLSVLITEQINLYLQMEQKPHKKEELMLANNVLKLAEDLLKELESPFKISGMSANPLVYNATKVVLLSAFSAVLTELLGFKLKLYKIKIP